MFDQGFGVFEIAVDGLDGVVDAGFLRFINVSVVYTSDRAEVRLTLI